MLKKMSAALLAVSLLAAPALAAGPAKVAAADAAQTHAVKPGAMKATAGKSRVTRMSRHHRRHHRHFARYHSKVSARHASARMHGVAKTRLGLNKAGHIKKASHKVGFNQMKKTGPKLSFKRATPATRRG